MRVADDHGEAPRGEVADRIRQYVVEHYLEPARRQGLATFTVRIGDVHRAMGTTGVSHVCAALKDKFCREHGLELAVHGPKTSTTTSYVFTFAARQGRESPLLALQRFLQMQGVAADMYRKLGGGSRALDAERDGWNGTAP